MFLIIKWMVKMRIKILSYSLTGNNETLANQIAKQLRTEHMIITEDRKRTIPNLLVYLKRKQV
jgi:flavodoxin